MSSIFNLFSTSKKTRKSKKVSKNLSKVSSKTKKNNSTGGKSKTELCSKKYKDKSIRGTPKNWAYNRCLKNDWERCKKLPPSGSNMYREFCD